MKDEDQTPAGMFQTIGDEDEMKSGEEEKENENEEERGSGGEGFEGPRLPVEGLLEGCQGMILVAQSVDVRVETNFIEPAVHARHFVAGSLAELVPRHLEMLHGPAQQASEDGGGFRHCEFVASEFDDSAGPFGRIGESHGGKSADIVHGDLLEMSVGVEGHGESSAQDGFVKEIAPILHEEDRAENSAGETQLNNVSLDFPFAFEMGHTGFLVGAGHGAIDEVGDAGGFGGVGHCFALAHFAVEAGVGVRLDRESAVSASEGAFEGREVFEVAGDKFDALEAEF